MRCGAMLCRGGAHGKARRVHLIWTVRSTALFGLFADTLAAVAREPLEGGRFGFSLFATRPSALEMELLPPWLRARCCVGRPTVGAAPLLLGGGGSGASTWPSPGVVGAVAFDGSASLLP